MTYHVLRMLLNQPYLWEHGNRCSRMGESILLTKVNHCMAVSLQSLIICSLTETRAIKGTIPLKIK